MIDFYGLWEGFLLLFVGLPSAIGAVVGAIWGWRRGKRGAGLITPALIGCGAMALCVFATAVLIFRA